MLVKTNAIVLSKIKYGDHDVIVKCYTKNRGIVSYLLRGILKSKKSNSKIAYYQSLSQLEIEENFKINQTLHYITDVKLSVPYKSMHTNVLKAAIVMFLSEVLTTTLREEEANLSLYDTSQSDLPYLNLRSGTFELQSQIPYTVSGENLVFMKQLLSIKFDELNSVKLHSTQRQSLLNLLLFYFELHQSDFRKPKSLQILNQVFS